MPYVPKKNRPALVPLCAVADVSGELNFQISVLMNLYIKKHGMSYDRLKDCTSACEEAAAEFRRRVMAPYEDEKIRENGDVFGEARALLPEPPY